MIFIFPMKERVKDWW